MAACLLNVYEPCVCLLPEEAKRGCEIPLEMEVQTAASHIGVLGTKPRLSEEQPALLTTESSLQSSTIFIIIIPILELYTTWKYMDTKLGSDYSFPTWFFFFSQLETVSQT